MKQNINQRNNTKHASQETEFEMVDENEDYNKLLEFNPYRPLFQLTPSNWRVVLYTSIITAVKYIEDRNIWNIDIVNTLSLFDLIHTNKYEHLFLNVLDFNMHVKNKLFEEYFKWLVLYKEFISG